MKKSVLFKFQIYFFLLGIFLFSCRQYNTSEHILKIENYYLNGEFARAIEEARKRTIKSDDKDRLLFLMESGSILHTMGEWKRSNMAFLEADQIAESLTKSIGKTILAFIINDKEKNFRAENFERVLIKFYIALNYLMLDQGERAMRYFKWLNIELQDIRDIEADYRINHAARYLYALLAESASPPLLNQARVQYNNLALSSRYRDQAQMNLYYLALRAKELEDLQKYAPQADQLAVLDLNFNPISPKKLRNYYLQPQSNNPLSHLGSLVIIHESGLAPIKKSRGKIGEDEIFKSFLQVSILKAMQAKENISLNFATILATIKNSENPIPQYVERIEKNKKMIPNLYLNDQSNRFFSPTIYDDYTQMAIQNYNEQYSSYVSRNVASITTKIITVMLTGYLIESKTEGNILGGVLSFMTSLIGGSIIASTIEPDLRAWNLTYDNLQIKRILLQPGSYRLKFKHPEVNFISPYPEQVLIRPDRATFIIIRSF